jgi:hypothetical protein
MNTNFVGAFYEIAKYGLDYLTTEEFERARSDKVSQYYRFLAKSFLLGRRDKEFWNYHRRKMIEVGAGFSKTHFAKALLAASADAVLNPKSTIERVLGLWRDRLRGRAQQNDGPHQADVAPGVTGTKA